MTTLRKYLQFRRGADKWQKAFFVLEREGSGILTRFRNEEETGDPLAAIERLSLSTTWNVENADEETGIRGSIKLWNSADNYVLYLLSQDIGTRDVFLAAVSSCLDREKRAALRSVSEGTAGNLLSSPQPAPSVRGGSSSNILDTSDNSVASVDKRFRQMMIKRGLPEAAVEHAVANMAYANKLKLVQKQEAQDDATLLKKMSDERTTDKFPVSVVGRLKDPSVSSDDLKTLELRLRTEETEWVEGFLKAGGVAELMRLLTIVCNIPGEKKTDEDWKLKYQILKNLIALMKSPDGIRAVLGYRGAIRIILSAYYSIGDDNYPISRPSNKLVIDMMVFFCFFVLNGYHLVLDAFERRWSEHRPKRDFYDMVACLRSHTSVEHKTSCMKLVNALVNISSELSSRSKMRKELLDQGFVSTLDELKRYNNRALDIQIDAFLEEMQDDVDRQEMEKLNQHNLDNSTMDFVVSSVKALGDKILDPVFKQMRKNSEISLPGMDDKAIKSIKSDEASLEIRVKKAHQTETMTFTNEIIEQIVAKHREEITKLHAMYKTRERSMEQHLHELEEQLKAAGLNPVGSASSESLGNMTMETAASVASVRVQPSAVVPGAPPPPPVGPGCPPPPPPPGGKGPPPPPPPGGKGPPPPPFGGPPPPPGKGPPPPPGKGPPPPPGAAGVLPGRRDIGVAPVGRELPKFVITPKQTKDVIAGTVWEKLDDSHFQMDMDEIIKYFGKVAKTKTAKEMNKKRADAILQEPSKILPVDDGKLYKSVEMFYKVFGKKEMTEMVFINRIKEYLTTFDVRVLNIETLSSLSENHLPDEKVMEQLLHWANEGGDPHILPFPDRYSWTLYSSIPIVRRRFSLYKHQLMLDNRISDVSSVIDNIEECCRELSSSVRIKYMFEALLAFSNTFNAGNKRLGGCFGLKLFGICGSPGDEKLESPIDYMSLMKSGKECDDSSTYDNVLQYFVDFLDKCPPDSPGALAIHFMDDLGKIFQSRFDLNHCQSTMSSINELRQIYTELSDAINPKCPKTYISASCENDCFHDLVAKTLEQCKIPLQSLQTRFKTVQDAFADLLKYWGEDFSKIKWELVFRYLQHLAALFQNVRKRNERMRELERKQNAAVKPKSHRETALQESKDLFETIQDMTSNLENSKTFSNRRRELQANDDAVEEWD